MRPTRRRSLIVNCARRNRGPEGISSLAAIAFTADCCLRLFDKQRNQGKSSDAIQPPPIEQSCRCQADQQNDRQITAFDRFDCVGSLTRENSVELRWTFAETSLNAISRSNWSSESAEVQLNAVQQLRSQKMKQNPGLRTSHRCGFTGDFRTVQVNLY